MFTERSIRNGIAKEKQAHDTGLKYRDLREVFIINSSISSGHFPNFHGSEKNAFERDLIRGAPGAG